MPPPVESRQELGGFRSGVALLGRGGRCRQGCRILLLLLLLRTGLDAVIHKRRRRGCCCCSEEKRDLGCFSIRIGRNSVSSNQFSLSGTRLNASRTATHRGSGSTCADSTWSRRSSRVRLHGAPPLRGCCWQEDRLVCLRGGGRDNAGLFAGLLGGGQLTRGLYRE